MGAGMTNDQAPPPSQGLEHDRRTPLSRLRYKDVEVQTWRIEASVVVVLAMFAFVGLLLMHELHARGH
jgi:hypothetical protein